MIMCLCGSLPEKSVHTTTIHVVMICIYDIYNIYDMYHVYDMLDLRHICYNCNIYGIHNKCQI